MTKPLKKEDAKKIVEKWLTVENVAEEYNLTPNTVRLMISRKKIPHAKIGKRVYFDPKVAEKYFFYSGTARLVNYDKEVWHVVIN